MSHRHASLLFLATSLLAAAPAMADLPDTATLYKNPQCGCCDEYARLLEQRGVDVTIVETRDIASIKQRHGIPFGLGACHTIEMGGYAVEGHVPFAALDRLFEQHPDTAGIGLAGMPAGTPGMPGPRQQEWNVYEFRDGEARPFMTL